MGSWPGLAQELRRAPCFVKSANYGAPISLDAYGALLETFVFSEVLKAASWGDQRFAFSHYRDKDQNEVDIVIENQERNIVGLEVKASATVTSSDFAG